MWLIHNPGLELWGVDPYKSYKDYTDMSEPLINKHKRIAIRRMARYPNFHFIEKTSMEAIDDFSDNSLDFVFIDANHTYPHVTQDINRWSMKVRSGGIISGDDYIEKGDFAVREAVNEYITQHNIPRFFTFSVVWALFKE